MKIQMVLLFSAFFIAGCNGDSKSKVDYLNGNKTPAGTSNPDCQNPPPPSNPILEQSDGSDGDLYVPYGSTSELVEGETYHFTSLYVEDGATLKLVSKDPAASNSITVLATSDCFFNGTIDGNEYDGELLVSCGGDVQFTDNSGRFSEELTQCPPAQ